MYLIETLESCEKTPEFYVFEKTDPEKAKHLLTSIVLHAGLTDGLSELLLMIQEDEVMGKSVKGEHARSLGFVASQASQAVEAREKSLLEAAKSGIIDINTLCDELKLANSLCNENSGEFIEIINKDGFYSDWNSTKNGPEIYTDTEWDDKDDALAEDLGVNANAWCAELVWRDSEPDFIVNEHRSLGVIAEDGIYKPLVTIWHAA